MADRHAYDPKTGKVLKSSDNGRTWVLDPNTPPPAGVTAGSPVAGGSRGASRSGQSPAEQAALNALNEQAGAAGETRRLYEQARGAVHRLHPGPFRGALLDAAVPTEQTSALGRVGAALLSPVARWSGIVSDQDVNDYQFIKGLQSQRVQTQQKEQRGVQTEGDAARIMLGDISPNKTEQVNNSVVALGDAKAARVQGRGAFYTQWANKYGLNGVDERGRSVEQAFQESISAPHAPAGWRIIP